jgi:N-acetylmuramoyl-L-alanine amidase
VPKWLLWVVLGVLIVGAIAAGSAALVASHSRAIVPTVAGLTTQVASERVSAVGLKLVVSDRRFSTLPVDTILSQDPEAGSTTTRGSAVTVVVSGGTEDFNMPDLIGQGLSLARSQLEQRGLQVQVTVQPSDQPSDTVLATNPTAGSPMHTGDAVVLTVAQNTGTPSTTTSSALTPFSLSGIRITLDPSAPVANQPDAAYEVARRLQSLLEASGATVLATRSSADTGTATSVTARQSRARENTPTVAVGLDVVSSGLPGIAVTYPSSSVATAAAAPSMQLASQIASGLASAGLSSRQTASGSDVVLSTTTAPYSRIVLGTTGSRDDLTNLADANWADKVARSIYQGIGAIYGVRNAGVTP